MGTTMTLAMSSGADLFLGHVGDSRAYLLRGGKLQVLTRDHSFAQALADSGVITQREAAVHRMRNVLLRSLGGQAARPMSGTCVLESGDQLLLCTDGLTDMVAEPRSAKSCKRSPRKRPATSSLPPPSPPAGKTTSPSCWPGTPGKGHLRARRRASCELR